MTQPVGTYDPVRRSLEYVLETLAARTARSLPADTERLLDEAGMRFNLSPNDAKVLARLFRESEKSGGRTDSRRGA